MSSSQALAEDVVLFDLDGQLPASSIDVDPSPYPAASNNEERAKTKKRGKKKRKQRNRQIKSSNLEQNCYNTVMTRNRGGLNKIRN